MNRRRRGGTLPLVIGVLLLLHFYLRPRLYTGPGAPDFLLVALLVLALRIRLGGAAVAGLVTGLLTDVLTPAHVGAGALAYTVVASLASWGRSVFFPESLLVNGGLFAVGTWLRNLILLAATGPVGGAVVAALGWDSVAQVVTTAIAGLLVTLGLRHRLDLRRER